MKSKYNNTYSKSRNLGYVSTYALRKKLNYIFDYLLYPKYGRYTFIYDITDKLRNEQDSVISMSKPTIENAIEKTEYTFRKDIDKNNSYYEENQEPKIVRSIECYNVLRESVLNNLSNIDRVLEEYCNYSKLESLSHKTRNISLVSDEVSIINNSSVNRKANETIYDYLLDRGLDVNFNIREDNFEVSMERVEQEKIIIQNALKNDAKMRKIVEDMFVDEFVKSCVSDYDITTVNNDDSESKLKESYSGFQHTLISDNVSKLKDSIKEVIINDINNKNLIKDTQDVFSHNQTNVSLYKYFENNKTNIDDDITTHKAIDVSKLSIDDIAELPLKKSKTTERIHVDFNNEFLEKDCKPDGLEVDRFKENEIKIGKVAFKQVVDTESQFLPVNKIPRKKTNVEYDIGLDRNGNKKTDVTQLNRTSNLNNDGCDDASISEDFTFDHYGDRKFKFEDEFVFKHCGNRGIEVEEEINIGVTGSREVSKEEERQIDGYVSNTLDIEDDKKSKNVASSEIITEFDKRLDLHKRFWFVKTMGKIDYKILPNVDFNYPVDIDLFVEKPDFIYLFEFECEYKDIKSDSLTIDLYDYSYKKYESFKIDKITTGTYSNNNVHVEIETLGNKATFKIKINNHSNLYYMIIRQPEDVNGYPVIYTVTKKFLGENHHPIPFGEDMGVREIPVHINVMVDFINILMLMWSRFYYQFTGYTGIQAVYGMVNLVYEWLSLESSSEIYDISDYYRCFRWLRWEAEKIYNIARHDPDLTGNAWIEKLIYELVEYIEMHHMDEMPVFEPIQLMDEYRNIFDDPSFDIEIVVDKIKGVRKKVIDTNKIRRNQKDKN